jgi:predicted transcriptional regulator
MRKLTNTEEHVMRILWDLGKAFVKDIISQYPLPKPPYNTISSVVRILEKKGFVSHNTYGNTHQYYPQISQDEYKRFYLKDALKNYFGNSFQNLVSFFAEKEEVDVQELEALIDQIKKEKSDHNG